jgi:hypothetical protein
MISALLDGALEQSIDIAKNATALRAHHFKKSFEIPGFLLWRLNLVVRCADKSATQPAVSARQFIGGDEKPSRSAVETKRDSSP